ncbi:MAG TPA: hypothetical protein ENK62_07895 [Chromatiales bacterium]|nr:hypothetical protein [Chromatiales bacterium]
MHSKAEPLIETRDPRQFFREAVEQAMTHQQVRAEADTVAYLINLLATFMRSETLFEETPEGLRVRPLAMLYLEAVQATHPGIRRELLRRLGDVALFVSGLFAESFNRRVVNIDYYVSMGGNAYGYLSQEPRLATASARRVFAELAEKFVAFVDVLNEVAEQARPGSGRDVLTLYERWIRSGSPRAARQLAELGITVVERTGRKPGIQ